MKCVFVFDLVTTNMPKIAMIKGSYTTIAVESIVFSVRYLLLTYREEFIVLIRATRAVAQCMTPVKKVTHLSLSDIYAPNLKI